VTGGGPPTYQAETDRTAAVRAWVGEINAQSDTPHTLRDLAASIRPLADQTATRAEARHAEPDEAYVTRLRPHHRTSVQVSGAPGSWNYCQSAHPTKPGVGAYRSPP